MENQTIEARKIKELDRLRYILRRPTVESSEKYLCYTFTLVFQNIDREIPEEINILTDLLSKEIERLENKDTKDNEVKILRQNYESLLSRHVELLKNIEYLNQNKD